MTRGETRQGWLAGFFVGWEYDRMCHIFEDLLRDGRYTDSNDWGWRGCYAKC